MINFLIGMNFARSEDVVTTIVDGKILMLDQKISCIG